MYIVHKKLLEQVLADVSPVSKSEESLHELPVFERFPVIHVARRKPPLYNLSLVVDDQVQFEAVEPPHGALALSSPALHCLVHVHTLDMAGDKRRGVDNGEPVHLPPVKVLKYFTPTTFLAFFLHRIYLAYENF